MECKLKLYNYQTKKTFTKTFVCEFDCEKFKRKLRYSGRLFIVPDRNEENYEKFN